MERPKKSKESVWDQDDDEENNSRGENLGSLTRRKRKGWSFGRDGRSSS